MATDHETHAATAALVRRLRRAIREIEQQVSTSREVILDTRALIGRTRDLRDSARDVARSQSSSGS